MPGRWPPAGGAVVVPDEDLDGARLAMELEC